MQVECAWGFTSALTESGDVYVWWPSGEILQDLIRQNDGTMDAQGDSKKAKAQTNEAGIKTIPCATWEANHNPTKLAGLPELPLLPGSDSTKSPVIIKIAAVGTLIALTNYGHVLRYSSLGNETQAKAGRWTYVCAMTIEYGTVLTTSLGYSCQTLVRWKK